MSIDERHLELRKHLDKLGFHQPLPLGAIGLVTALVDDLVQTTETLRETKHEVKQLIDEKAAWDLGVEPYKCDNSRLLSEVNSLHMQMLKLTDGYEIEVAQLRIQIRNLTHNNKILEDRNIDLYKKIKELENKLFDQEKKSKALPHKKPFVSTVKSNVRLPGTLDLRDGNDQLYKKCSCTYVKRNDVLNEIEKLKVEIQNQEEQLRAYEKQNESREREIMRLHALFTGGRPADALARDCCYKNVSALTEDVQYLQEQKLLLENKLLKMTEAKNENQKRADMLKEKCVQLQRDMKDLEKVALNVETQANDMVMEKMKEIDKLKETIQKTHSRLLNLEQGLDREQNTYDYSTLNGVYESKEDSNLLKKLNDLTVSEKQLKEENEKLKTKYSKVKQKLAENGDAPGKIWHELEKAREEKDLYQKEYSKLLLDAAENKELQDKITHLSHEVNERNMLISTLKSQVTALQSQIRPKSQESDIQKNMTLQANIHRLERERDIAIAAKNQLLIEQENLKEQIRLSNEAQMLERQNHEKHIANLNQQISHLQASERELIAHQRPNSATIGTLKEENYKLINELKLRETEITQLKVAHGQIKVLLEQTERAMAEQRSKLNQTENIKEHVEQHIQKLETENLKLSQDVAELRSDITTLKTNNHVLEKEKDRLKIDLDMKTEKVYHLENNLESMKAAKRDLQDNVDRLQRKLSNINSETIEKETTLRTVSSETEHLRKQVALLKRTCDNTLNENSRLTNELADAQVAVNVAKQAKLKAEEDTETLKEQIKQYVTEVERVNNILAEKEQALLDMIDNYKSMTHDTHLLEEAKQSLTYENNEARQLLKQATLKITDLEEEIELRGAQIRDYERQVHTLSAQIVELENDVQSLRHQISQKESELQSANMKIEQLKREKNDTNALVQSTNKKAIENVKLNEIPSVRDFGTYTKIPTSKKDETISEVDKEFYLLREKVNKLEEKIGGDQDLENKTNALAQEYKAQVQELRQMITDERFAQKGSTETVNPYPTL